MSIRPQSCTLAGPPGWLVQATDANAKKMAAPSAAPDVRMGSLPCLGAPVIDGGPSPQGGYCL